MKLLIHDLKREEWDRISGRYAGWEVISDNGRICSCAGCFGCWIKTPGECVIEDGYERIPVLMHRAEEVVVMSRYTYGGFSSFVKNVFDRNIGWVLPFFEIINDEMHHKKRYPEDKPFTFIFRGNKLSQEEKDKATKYVRAVCINFHGVIRDIIFEEDEVLQEKSPEQDIMIREGNPGTILLNCSLRGDRSNSVRFLDRLAAMITGETQRLNLAAYLRRTDELLSLLASAEKIVFGMPMYVDGIPSAALRIMEAMERICAVQKPAGKKIYLICNMGFYESSQQVHLVSMMHSWCECCGFDYSGCVAIGAGEMLGMMMAATNIEKGAAAEVGSALAKLSEAINKDQKAGDLYAGPKGFPRCCYMFIANSNWPRGGRKNGLKRKDLYRCPSLRQGSLSGGELRNGRRADLQRDRNDAIGGGIFFDHDRKINEDHWI